MADRLWEKGLALDEAVLRFTVGDDPLVDRVLVRYDAVGSAAHARMLAHVGLLDKADARALVAALKEIEAAGREGKFEIRPEQEDVHTAIEAALTARLGEAGKRIHLGRSRNDQVILALRLYLRDRLLDLGRTVATAGEAFLAWAEAHADAPLPGYTHMRRAMPATFGLWAAAFAEALVEELEALRGVYERVDRCPLGSAAGFGVPLPIDRGYTAELLGFSRVQRSVVDVQNSRGRHETAVVAWAAGVGSVLEKFFWDVALYSTEEFGFLKLPDAFTTGSSIMPQKRNPDVVELGRGRCRWLRGMHGLVEQIASGLPSNYHRDYQLLKLPLFAALDGAADLFEMTGQVVSALIADRDAAASASSDELYAAHEAYRLVMNGLPFRDAYAAVAGQIAARSFAPDRAALTAAHTGAAGDLGLGETSAELLTLSGWLDATRAEIDERESAVFTTL